MRQLEEEKQKCLGLETQLHAFQKLYKERDSRLMEVLTDTLDMDQD